MRRCSLSSCARREWSLTNSGTSCIARDRITPTQFASTERERFRVAIAGVLGAVGKGATISFTLPSTRPRGVP